MVLVWLGFEYGKTPAALAAKSLRRSFKEIKHVLVVGVCGGVPKESMVLGDVVISTALHKYDKWKQFLGSYEPVVMWRPRGNMGGVLVKMSHSKESKDDLKRNCAAYLKVSRVPTHVSARHTLGRIFEHSLPPS